MEMRTDWQARLQLAISVSVLAEPNAVDFVGARHKMFFLISLHPAAKQEPRPCHLTGRAGCRPDGCVQRQSKPRGKEDSFWPLPSERLPLSHGGISGALVSATPPTTVQRRSNRIQAYRPVTRRHQLTPPSTAKSHTLCCTHTHIHKHEALYVSWYFSLSASLQTADG